MRDSQQDRLDKEDLAPASEGKGPLLERDYWAVIRECGLTCSEIALLLRERFSEFAPESFAAFRRTDGVERPLDVGSTLEVNIRMEGKTAVRVVHTDTNSITLGTVADHPEAGRITFGAYPNERGDVIFHIQSRARSSSSVRYAGFLLAGEPMQTNTWTDFVDRLAHTVGEGVIGAIRAEVRKVDDNENDDNMHSPTFIATNDSNG